MTGLDLPRLDGRLRAMLVDRPRTVLLRQPPLGPVAGRVALAGLTLVINGCVPRTEAGGLEPTLTRSQVTGGSVAFQNGIPVPSFEVGARPRLDLDGSWLVETATFDANLSLTPRRTSLPAIVAAAAGREQPAFDDSTWTVGHVPGTVNPPPERREIGAWYRRRFVVPADWAGRAATLKFGAVNYVADVWLNGTWLGYHEGGYTPFAFDATPSLVVGGENVLVVRVDNPPWGTRNDIVPWGLADWWNFGGITRPVWLEASAPLHVARADVAPHLDGADVSVVLENRSDAPAVARPLVQILPARVSEANLLDPDPRSLVGVAQPIAGQTLEPIEAGPRAVLRIDATFVLADASLWSPTLPSLYVVR
ncbi:MAG TPA: sugar-binding domain-containing protein, partial [Candidatus Limnocylindrales bacterium]